MKPPPELMKVSIDYGTCEVKVSPRSQRSPSPPKHKWKAQNSIIAKMSQSKELQ
jgi:hypothetical protein